MFAVNTLVVIGLYCRAFVVHPMWNEVVKLKASHVVPISALRHYCHDALDNTPRWNTRSRTYAVALVALQTHVSCLSAWAVS